MKKILTWIFGQRNVEVLESMPLEMPIVNEDKFFLDVAIRICSAKTLDELIECAKLKLNPELRNLIILRLREIQEKNETI